MHFFERFLDYDVHVHVVLDDPRKRNFQPVVEEYLALNRQAIKLMKNVNWPSVKFRYLISPDCSSCENPLAPEVRYNYIMIGILAKPTLPSNCSCAQDRFGKNKTPLVFRPQIDIIYIHTRTITHTLYTLKYTYTYITRMRCSVCTSVIALYVYLPLY